MVNDPTVVLEMLSDPGVRVVASLAPSYIGVYGRDARDKVVSSLYRMGFEAVEETAIGAHEVSAAYKELMDAGEMPVILTTCCPTVNSLITKYYPDLIPMMAPVVSPVLGTRPHDQAARRAGHQGGLYRPVPVQDQGDSRPSGIGGCGAVLPPAG